MADKVLRFDLNTPGALLLGSNFAVASPPYFDISDSYKNFTRYFLLPKSVTDLSALNGLKKVIYGVRITQNRTKGSSDTWVTAISGTLESQTVICDNLVIYSGSARTDVYTGDYKEDTLLAKIKNNTALVTYNGQMYYCLKVHGGPGGILSKFTGTYTIDDFYIEATYEDTAKTFIGDSPVTSAYLGNTKLTGIYLGDTKLL